MKTKEEIQEIVVGIISEQFGVTPDFILPETNLTETLAADSLDLVEVVMEIEEVFEINIPDEDIDGLKTVGNVVDYLFEKYPDHG
jgi:acyl carrier protein